jgi:hypothetical protein
LNGSSVAVTNVAVRLGGTRVAVSAGRGWVGGGVSLGNTNTGVAEGRGEAVGRGGATVVAISTVGVAGKGRLNEQAPRRSRATNAGIIFFMASPFSTRID